MSFVFFIGNFKRPGWPQLESVEGTIAAMRKESSVKQFITIREMDRRQSQADELKKARIIESKKKAAAAKVKLAAAVESADLMADIAMIEKAVAAASRKKTTHAPGQTRTLDARYSGGCLWIHSDTLYLAQVWIQ